MRSLFSLFLSAAVCSNNGKHFIDLCCTAPCFSVLYSQYTTLLQYCTLLSTCTKKVQSKTLACRFLPSFKPVQP